MRFVSHRGNIDGKCELENTPELVDFAILLGFDVEVDVWAKNEKLYFGHDAPKREVEPGYIVDRSERLWLHCKNPEALRVLSWYGLNTFGHDRDKFVVTSWKYTWTADHYCFKKGAIAVLPELCPKKDLSACEGICSDFIGSYRRKYSA